MKRMRAIALPVSVSDPNRELIFQLLKAVCDARAFIEVRDQELVAHFVSELDAINFMDGLMLMLELGAEHVSYSLNADNCTRG